MNPELEVPNHHAHFGTFRGAAGLVAASSMVVGRDGDAALAERLSDLGPDDIVVDIGCGPGVAARHAARVCARVTGVDPAPVMLRVARLFPRGSGKVRYVSGSAESLPVADQSATVAWSIAAVHHWTDLQAGLLEVRRILQPGGRFVAIERRTEAGAHGHASHGWTEAQGAVFADRCREHGFVEARVEESRTGRRSTISVVATAP
jgi:ubiquinone/menaquinone biosynthesis C-methylase UbiE